MTTFAVTNSSQVLDSVNYLLSNLDTGNITGNITVPDGTLVANVSTGQITATGNVTAGANAFSYINQYINLRYANNSTGSSGFSTVPTNSQYFGVYNSNIATPSSNPAEYVWRQVSGGFGTTKTIYYSSIGGRQVQFAAANTAPSSNFVISVANVAIDLDVITTAAGLPGERGPVVMAAVLTTADPTSASSSTLTGWFSSSRSSLTPPVGTGLTPVLGDTANFTYPTTGVSAAYEYNGSVWVSVIGQVINGNTVVGNSLPGNSIVTQSVEGNKLLDNTVTYVQIATPGIIADNIFGNTITGNKIAADTITGNKIAANTITGNNIVGNTITGNLIAANTITGNLIAANTITGNNLVANTITAANVVSINANIGNISSTGYWLQASTGNARFGGNVSIGNNASIGGNLTVTGLISTGNLVSNSVITTTMVPAAVSSGIGNSSTTTQTFATPTASTYYPINTTANIIPSFNNQTVYVWAQSDVTLDVNNAANQSYVAVATAKLIRTNSANVSTVLSTQSVSFSGLGSASPYQPYPQLRNTFVWGGFTDTLPTVILYTYSMEVQYAISGGPTVSNILVGDRNILLQTLKR